MRVHERTKHAGQRHVRIMGLLAFAGALSSGAFDARADDAPPLTPGAKVRVRVGSAGVLRIGQLMALDDTTLTMRRGAREGPIVIRRGEITGVEVSAGQHSRWRKTLIGAGIMAGVGAVIGLASGNDSADSFIQLNAGQKALVGVIVLAPVGALIGVASRPGQKWRTVEPGQVRLGLGASPGGGVTVSLTAGW